MKILLNIMLLAFLVVSCGSNNHKTTKGEDELTEKQLEYAQSLLTAPAVTNVNWTTTRILEVKLQSGSVGENNTDNDNYVLVSKVIADEWAKDGYEYTGKDICIKILSQEDKELGYTCVPNKLD